MNRSGNTVQPNQYEGGGTKTVSMFSKLVSQGSSFVMEGVKNLVVKRHVSTIKGTLPFLGNALYALILLHKRNGLRACGEGGASRKCPCNDFNF